MIRSAAMSNKAPNTEVSWCFLAIMPSKPSSKILIAINGEAKNCHGVSVYSAIAPMTNIDANRKRVVKFAMRAFYSMLHLYYVGSIITISQGF